MGREKGAKETAVCFAGSRSWFSTSGLPAGCGQRALQAANMAWAPLLRQLGFGRGDRDCLTVRGPSAGFGPSPGSAESARESGSRHAAPGSCPPAVTLQPNCSQIRPASLRETREPAAATAGLTTAQHSGNGRCKRPVRGLAALSCQHLVL